MTEHDRDKRRWTLDPDNVTLMLECYNVSQSQLVTACHADNYVPMGAGGEYQVRKLPGLHPY